MPRFAGGADGTASFDAGGEYTAGVSTRIRRSSFVIDPPFRLPLIPAPAKLPFDAGTL